jgi:putative spermidine/putrescine transport system permease protein
VPLLVPIPLSFNSQPFFTFPLAGFSLRWYRTVLGPGEWRAGLEHSLIIASATTVLASSFGTLAALGLSSPRFPVKRLALIVLLAPLAVPVVISAVGMYLLYAPLGLAGTFQGIILAHTVLASPFVIVTVGASLVGFDRTLMRAAASCGARPVHAFRTVMLPLILPGILSGGAFAFVTSFDEVVIAMFLTSAQQRTLPIVMFSGLREQIDPSITAAATLMMMVSIVLLVLAEVLRRRAARRVRAVE